LQTICKMKIAILVGLLVVSVLLVPPTTASPKGRSHQKRAVAAWVATANYWINFGLGFVPNGLALETAIDKIVTVAGTTPFSISNLLSAIFSVVTAAINMADANASNPLTKELNTLITDICTLVTDAVAGNFKVLATDIDNVVCAAEALGGLTKCNLTPLSNSINALVTAAENNAPAATIVTDAFGIVAAAINIGTSAGKVPANVVTAIQNLMTNICTLVVDCVTLNTAAIGGAITAVITAATTLGTTQ